MKNFLLIALFSLASISLFAQTRQIHDLQKQQQALQEDIKNTNKLFLDVKKHTTTIIQRIQLINKQIDSRKQMITLQQQEVGALDNELGRLENEIVRLNKELKLKQDKYAKAIKGMLNNRQNENKLFFILSGKSLGESLRRMRYLKDYSHWQKSQAEEIKKQNAELNAKKEALAKAKKDREKALLALQNERTKLEAEEKSRQAEVTQAKGKQKELQKSLQTKQQQMNRLNTQIEKLIAEEVARQEREAEARRRAAEAERKRKAEAAAAKARKDAEARGKTQKRGKTETRREPVATEDTPRPKIESGDDVIVASAESFNLSRNFAANKGKLPMPVTGTATIVGQFGVNRHSEWNISTNSNGIDIQTQQGANIRSVFEGEVSKVFSVPGSNTCVIIRHGDYYTFYGNIYDLFVKQGDKVKTGQAIGRIYTDSDTGISVMHFQLWQKTSKQNPAPWLRR